MWGRQREKKPAFECSLTSWFHSIPQKKVKNIKNCHSYNKKYKKKVFFSSSCDVTSSSSVWRKAKKRMERILNDKTLTKQFKHGWINITDLLINSYTHHNYNNAGNHMKMRTTPGKKRDQNFKISTFFPWIATTLCI